MANYRKSNLGRRLVTLIVAISYATLKLVYDIGPGSKYVWEKVGISHNGYHRKLVSRAV